MCCVALCCVALCCIALRCIALRCVALLCRAIYRMVSHCDVVLCYITCINKPHLGLTKASHTLSLCLEYPWGAPGSGSKAKNRKKVITNPLPRPVHQVSHFEACHLLVDVQNRIVKLNVSLPARIILPALQTFTEYYT